MPYGKQMNEYANKA
ncbi:unnamed protein product [Victoria cruziana]